MSRESFARVSRLTAVLYRRVQGSFRGPFMSRPSYRVQLWSSALEGVFFGVLLNVAFVAGRDLGAPRTAIVWYMAATAMPMLLTPCSPGGWPPSVADRC